ncbi:MAG: HAMP domain-containing sensor histidine kinase [candidate division WOR-3 bacterium]
MNFRKLVLVFFIDIVLVVSFFVYLVQEQQRIFREESKRDAQLRSVLVRQMFSHLVKSGKEIDDSLLKVVVDSTNLDYVALLGGRKLLHWASKYEGFLPVESFEEIKPGRVRLIKLPDYSIVEFSFYLDSTIVVCGFSDEPFSKLTRITVYGMAFLVVVLLIIFGITTFSFYFLNRKLKERELVLVKEEEKAKYFRELAGFSSQVAHEIKNPLNSISMAIQLAKQKGLSGDLLKIIEDETNRLNSIVKRFSSVSKGIEMHLEEVDLTKVVSDVITDAKVFATAYGVKIEFNANGFSQKVKTDPLLLKQALFNIIKNAIEAFEGVFREEKVVKVNLKKEKRKVIISIEDNGSGMTDEEVKRAFDLFYSTKSQGMGLGLSVVRRIMDALGGEVRLVSKKGEGTKVELILTHG